MRSKTRAYAVADSSSPPYCFGIVSPSSPTLRELSDHFFADCFVFVEFRGVDDVRRLHAIDLAHEPANDSGLFRIALVERRREGKQQFVVNDAGKNSARERRLELTHLCWSCRDLFDDSTCILELRRQHLRSRRGLFACVRPTNIRDGLSFGCGTAFHERDPVGARIRLRVPATE